jgi:hypothetical protein
MHGDPGAENAEQDECRMRAFPVSDPSAVIEPASLRELLW